MYKVVTRPEGSRGEVSALPLIFLFLSYLICKPQSHAFWAWSRVKAARRTSGTQGTLLVELKDIRTGWKLMGFLAFLVLCFAPATYIIQTHCCCESDDR